MDLKDTFNNHSQQNFYLALNYPVHIVIFIASSLLLVVTSFNSFTSTLPSPRKSIPSVVAGKFSCFLSCRPMRALRNLASGPKLKNPWKTTRPASSAPSTTHSPTLTAPPTITPNSASGTRTKARRKPTSTFPPRKVRSENEIFCQTELIRSPCQ